MKVVLHLEARGKTRKKIISIEKQAKISPATNNLPGFNSILTFPFNIYLLQFFKESVFHNSVFVVQKNLPFFPKHCKTKGTAFLYGMLYLVTSLTSLT